MKEKIITKSFERLLARGDHRGFITYDELGKSLGKRGKSTENLEKAVIIIFDKKISLVAKNLTTNRLRKKSRTKVIVKKVQIKAMIQSECTLEKWAELNFYLEKVRLRLQKE